MADYFKKYYYTFHDARGSFWRVDIMDSEGSTPTEPSVLPVSGEPLITEVLDSDERKNTAFLGRQISISYIFDGDAATPDPEVFFGADERRFRVEVRSGGTVSLQGTDGALDGVYWVKPDFCERPFLNNPYYVLLRAVDGMSFCGGITFNMDDGTGLLKYDKVSLYEALCTRGLFQVIDPTTPINVLQSLYPSNIEPDTRMLFGLFVHTDIFYDFVSGAVTVKQASTYIANAFYARMFISKGEIWLIRTQDLNQLTYEIDRYTDSSTVTTTTPAGFLKVIGPDLSYDGIPVQTDGKDRQIPALKRVDYEVDYKGINRLTNFQWAVFDGNDYAGWVRNFIVGSQIIVGRTGAGTLLDSYKMFIPYPQTDNDIQQESAIGIVSIGDVFDFEMRYRFANVKTFQFSIVVITNNVGGSAFRLLQDGTWTYGTDLAGLLTVNRSGKKREGTLKIKSVPIPKQVPGGTPQSGPFGLRIEFFVPSNPESMEPGEPDGVEIFPLKLGVAQLQSKGRHVRSENSGLYSKVQDVEQFQFIDTGDEGVSNTIFTGSGLVPAEAWDNDKPPVEPDDIENHMSESEIDQYQKSTKGLDVTIYSNNIGFENPLRFVAVPGRIFMQVGDKYNNRTCIHDMKLLEVLEEGTGSATTSQWDIEDEKD